jgi:predicted ester cyclase
MVSEESFQYALSVGLPHETGKHTKGEPSMSNEENKALVRRFVEEFWNQGNTAAADELMTADATIVLPGSGPVNKAGFKAFATTFRSAFPDWHSTPEELIAEGDHVCERWTGRGTHRGTFQGIAPTGRQVAVPGFVSYRVISGKIAEFRGLLDAMSLLHQLGALPPSG